MSVLKINMTYQCTAKCRHCRFACDQSPHSIVDFDLVMQCIDTLQKHNNLELVVLLGGEPGLVAEMTHTLVSEVRKRGICARVETNASWATSEEAAYSFLDKLYSQDCAVMFSLDSFHEPFVPLDNVERAIRVSEEFDGFYNLEVAYMAGPGSSNVADLRTDQLLAELSRRLGHLPREIYRGNIFFTGQAAYTLADSVAVGRGVPKDICDTAPWWNNGSFSSLELLILDSEGYLSKGCNVAIGNIKHTPVLDVIRSFDAHQHPVFSTLIKSGPFGLAEEASRLGYTIKTDYADKCHLCQEARDVLEAAYPEYIIPIRRFQS
ncbi:4Fe-4S cluster-binding domain-containing protein [bacterium]|nr:4Fe-4S cluster-binding domain-containing protein [bacterium]